MELVQAAQQHKTQYFTEPQIKQIIDNEPDLTRQTAFILASDTGMRAGEMVAVQSQHILWDKKVIMILDSKKGAFRPCPLSNETLAALERFIKEKKPSKYLFPVCEVSLNNWIQSACRRIKLRPDVGRRIRWHSWRGTFVRLNQHRGDKWLMMVTGDSYQTLLRYYSELTIADLVRKKEER